MTATNMNVLNQVFILFLILGIGYIARKRDIIDARVNKGMTDILLNITVPATVFASLNTKFDRTMLYNASLLLLISTILHLGFFIAGKFAFVKNKPGKAKVLRMISTFSNCAFMGYPVMQGILGNVGVFYAAIYVIPFNILIFSAGELVFSGAKDLKDIVKGIFNPSIYAVIIGLIIFINSITLPAFLSKTAVMLGSMTSPMSMLIIGAILAESPVKEVFKDIAVYYGAIIRLFIAPLITYFALRLFGISGIVLQVAVILQAMPVAALVTILAQKHDCEAAFASKLVFITTVISIVTIPTAVALLQMALG